MNPDSRVLVVDDDPLVLRALERVLRMEGLTVESFDSPTSFLEHALPDDARATCLVLELRLPVLSGLDLQDLLTTRAWPVSIVFLSGASDVPSTARAMRGGAVDFLVKPVDESQLLDAVSRALARDEERLRQDRARHALQQRLERLTARERQVCDLVTRGLLNKQIAFELGTSEKTVKIHRGRVMHKLEVDSVAALVRLLSSKPRSFDAA